MTELASDFVDSDVLSSTTTTEAGLALDDEEQFIHVYKDPIRAPMEHLVYSFIHRGIGFKVLISCAIAVTFIMFGFSVYLCLKCFRRIKREPTELGRVGCLYPQQTFQDLGTSSTTSSLNGNSRSKRMIPHKNIITPEKFIPFVVPTIPIKAQPRQYPLQGPEPILEEQYPTTSSVCYPEPSAPTLYETQFYPQYEFQDTSHPQIGFMLSYSVSSQILSIFIIQGRNFPDPESEVYGHSSIKYCVHVKVYPGRGTKQKTSDSQLSSSNTVDFNQQFMFHVKPNVLQTKVLKLRVVESGMMRKSLLGVVNMALKDLPSVNVSERTEIKEDFRTAQIWKKLESPIMGSEPVKLEVSLKWSPEPAPGILSLKILEAVGLHEITETEYTTTYVKVTLQEHGNNVKSKKSRLIRWGSIPNYDDTFVVTVPFHMLQNVSFMLMLVARGRLGSKTTIGKVYIGPEVTFPSSLPKNTGNLPRNTTGSVLWEDMIHQPNIDITRSLELFP